MNRATWSRLRSGAWGVRIETMSVPRPGDSVVVERANGDRATVTVASVVWHGRGVALCEVVASRRPLASVAPIPVTPGLSIGQDPSSLALDTDGQPDPDASDLGFGDGTTSYPQCVACKLPWRDGPMCKACAARYLNLKPAAPSEPTRIATSPASQYVTRRCVCGQPAKGRSLSCGNCNLLPF